MRNEDIKVASSALKLAIAKTGGTSALARLICVTKGAVSQWTVCPMLRVLEIEKISGVPRQDLRPDLYPRGD